MLAIVTPAAAQLPAFERALPTTATLPESNEAALLVGRFQDALARGDHRQAIEIIAQVQTLPPLLAPVPASRSYYPVAALASRLAGQLPPPAIELYRQLHDAEVTARWTVARDTSDIATLQTLFESATLSTPWPEIGEDLAGFLLDTGQDAEAVRVLRELIASSSADTAQLQLQLAVALARSDARAAARRVLEGLAGRGAGNRPPRLPAVAAWLESLAPRAALQPLCAPGALLEAPMPTTRTGDYRDEDAAIAGVMEAARRLPLVRPVLIDDALVVRARGVVSVLDAWTLDQRWSRREAPAIGAEPTENPPSADDLPTWLGLGDTLQSSANNELLLMHPLRQAVSAGFGYVYTVEGLGGPSDLPEPAFRRVFGGQRGAPNELVAREIRTGRIVWRSGSDPASPLLSVAFQDAPVVAGSELLVVGQIDDEVRLFALEPHTGLVLRDVLVVGPPTHPTTLSGGRAPLLVDESSAYVLTGNGVIACFALPDLTWRFAAVYPNTLADQLRVMNWQGGSNLPPPPFEPPFVANDLLIAAPIDSQEIIAIDRFSGRERWRRPREPYFMLVGAVERGLVVGASELVCLDYTDGVSVVWRTTPLAISGRPVISEESIFVPTRRGIVTVDGATGRVLADPALLEQLHASARPPAQAADSGVLAPLATVGAAGPDSVYFVSANRVLAATDVERAAARATQRLRSRPDDSSAATMLARIALLQGEPAQALAALEPLSAEKLARSATARRLRTQALVQLAASESDLAIRLERLRQAADSVDDPDESAAIALQIGSAFEAAGQREAAIQHYGALLVAGGPGGQVRSGPGLSQSVVLVARQRLEGILAGFAADDAALLVEQLLSQAADLTGSAALVHIAPLCTDAALRIRLFGELARRRLAPELLDLFAVPDDLASGLPPSALLARWDAHVSMGALAAARLDEQRWNARTMTAEDQLEPEDTRRLNAIRVAQRKLEAAIPPDFTAELRRQWSVSRAALLADTSGGPTGRAVTLLTRRTEDDVLQLHRLADGTLLRQHDAPMRAAPAAEQRGLWRGREAGPQPLYAGQLERGWPMVQHGPRGVVPVGRGLLCVGMGPERYGGAKLWTHAAPEWTTVPAELPGRLAAGQHGVFVAVRPDRLTALNWTDGTVRWERDLGSATVEQLTLIGERVVVRTSGARLLSCNAADGGDLRTLSADQTAAVEVCVSGEVLVVFSGSELLGLDPVTLERRWRCSVDGAGQLTPVVDTELVLLRNVDGWMAINTATGEVAARDLLSELRNITAAGSRESRIYLAGAAQSEDDDAIGMVIASLDASTLKVVWQREEPTQILLSGQQLLSHPTLIPLLISSGAGSRESQADERRTLELMCINRGDGSVAVILAVGDWFTETTPSRELFLHVERGRVVIQAYGQAIALGSGLSSSAP